MSDFVDSRNDDQKKISTAPVLTKYLVLRSGNQTPERLTGPSTDEEALDYIQNQIRSANGASKIVYLFKLVAAEEYVSSSRTLSPEDLEARNKSLEA